jgi:potassium intermediate/small conductance calcium-activated channel subfamily N
MLLYILKFYYLLKVITSFTIWSSDKVYKIGIKHKLTIGTSFIIKAQFKYSTYIFMGISFICLVGIFGFLLRTFEYGFEPEKNFKYNGNAINNPNFEDYTDTFWVIIITMMTVGYGDIFPSTHFGRVVVFFSALCGTILTSTLIAAMGSFVTFSPKEKKVHNIIHKNKQISETEHYSVFLIMKILKLAKIKKDSKVNIEEDEKLNKSLLNGKKSKNYVKINKSSLRDYLNCLISVKATAVKFYRLNKISKTNTIHSDELLSELDKKFHKDSENIAPLVDDIRYIFKLTNTIRSSEKEINKCLINLKIEQDNIAEYLIKYNQFHYDLFNKRKSQSQNLNLMEEKKKKVAFSGV